MVCSKHFVISLRVNGKILRDSDYIVTLPFGSEYQLFLKNLRSRRAMVNVSVDGQDATDGRLVIGANSSVTLERFIRNGNLSRGNRFKFIERTANIEAHRGIKEDDGIIRCEFWGEKEVIDQPIVRHHYYDEWYPVQRPYYPPYNPQNPWRPYWGETICQTETTTTGGIGSVTYTSGGTNHVNAQNVCAFNMASDFDRSMELKDSGLNDAGITVPGSESNQQFYRTAGFQLESNSTVIVLQLRGEVGGVQVAAPVTVEQKPTCLTCGKINRATNRFCDQCGTALQLF